MSILIGQDSGCAYIKTAFYNDKGEIVEHGIPSLLKRGKSTVGLGDDRGVTYLEGREEWSINPDPIATADTRFDSYPYSTINCVLSLHALKESGFTSEDDLQIASGIPLNHFYEGSDLNTGNIEDKLEIFNRTITIHGGGDVPKPNIAQVYPEALGGWIDICLDDKGNDVEKQSQPVGLVDIGGRTTDIAVVLPGFKIEPDFTGTINIGYLDVCSKLNEFLNDQYKCGDLNTAVLDESLRTKTIKLYRDGVIDVSQEVDDAIKIISGEVMREVERKLNKANHLLGVCYFGGGAEHMQEQLKKKEHVFIPERPQFSNARGYLKTLKFLQG